MEEERMRKNAWKVDTEVAARIDDTSFHLEYIKCLVSAKPDDGLVFNQDLLKEYSSKSVEQKKKEVPGASYIKEATDVIEAHYQKGELYIEFLKDDCSKTSSDGKPCTECKSGEWISPSMCRIPRPVPDASKLPDLSLQRWIRVLRREK